MEMTPDILRRQIFHANILKQPEKQALNIQIKKKSSNIYKNNLISNFHPGQIKRATTSVVQMDIL